MTPRLAVLTACYNDGDLLAKSVISSLRQTVDAIEVCVIDNGSTDTTASVAAWLAYHDPRVSVLTLAENVGHPGAMNRAVAATSAPWCLIVNADDWIAPDMVERVLSVADGDPDVNCVFSPLQCFGSQHHVIRYPAYVAAEAAERQMVPGPRAFRRDLWDALGGEDESWPIGADWDWVVRASVLGLLQPVQLAAPLYFFRVPPLDAPRLSQRGVDHFPALQSHMRSHATLTRITH